jgi:hypothetical protein
MLPPPIPDIPADSVGDVVQSFITNDSVQKLTVDPQSNGKFTVTPVG